jgi:NADH:ubiquinone oxidoreductase subunit 2 (subunit N)
MIRPRLFKFKLKIMPSKSTKLLDDVLYAICMYFASLLDEHVPKEAMVFILLIVVLVSLLQISSFLDRVEETLWSDILKESVRTVLRTCSFLIISFFTHTLSERWERNREIYFAEKVIIPCIFVFVGISVMKYVTNEEKRMEIKYK